MEYSLNGSISKEYEYVSDLKSINPKHHLIKEKRKINHHVAVESDAGIELNGMKLEIISSYAEFLMKKN